MENKIDLNVLGNGIQNEKMRKAFFVFCGDVAVYLSGDQHDEDEHGSIEQYVDYLIDDATKLATVIKEKLDEDNVTIFPFDIGHDMIHIIAKQLEADPQKEKKTIKSLEYLSKPKNK